MTQKMFLDTSRRKTAFFRLGSPANPKLFLIHGNASSSAFFFPTIIGLAEHFDVIAPDLNGFGDTEANPVHAPTALRALPGTRGISNALAPQYASMADFVDIKPNRLFCG